jgi:hypothetical protein
LKGGELWSIVERVPDSWGAEMPSRGNQTLILEQVGAIKYFWNVGNSRNLMNKTDLVDRFAEWGFS